MPPMGVFRLVALVLLFVLPLIDPLAFATPIDPSYPGGFYDNGDQDDVMTFLSSCSASLARPLTCVAEPLWIVVASRRDVGTLDARPPCQRPRESRAPPARVLLFA